MFSESNVLDNGGVKYIVKHKLRYSTDLDCLQCLIQIWTLNTTTRDVKEYEMYRCSCLMIGELATEPVSERPPASINTHLVKQVDSKKGPVYCVRYKESNLQSMISISSLCPMLQSDLTTHV